MFFCVLSSYAGYNKSFVCLLYRSARDLSRTAGSHDDTASDGYVFLAPLLVPLFLSTISVLLMKFPLSIYPAVLNLVSLPLQLRFISRTCKLYKKVPSYF
jgi:hypothetical protein